MKNCETAVKLLVSDMRKIITNQENYPSTEEMSSTQATMSYLPESLQVLLDIVVTGKDEDVKKASLGHAIIQAARPKVLIAPLQLGLGVQVHHHTNSKFLVVTLHKHGFCSSYEEVKTFERNAAASQGTDLPLSKNKSGDDEDKDGDEEKKAADDDEQNSDDDYFVQHVADNVDVNIRTLDGNGTFHGMGIVATITPAKLTKKQLIPRLKITKKELAYVGRIDAISSIYNPSTVIQVY